MDILLSDPEILKKMIEITNKEKEEKNNNNNINNNNNNINFNSKKESQIKDKVSFKQTIHQIKIQTDNIKEEDISNKVNNILNKEKPIKSMKDIINDELIKQEKWKLRFDKKKKINSKKINIEGEINYLKSKSGDAINFIDLNVNNFDKNINKEKENKNEEIIKDKNKNEEILKEQNEILENKKENNIKEIEEINANKKDNQIESKKENIDDDVKKIEIDENFNNIIKEKLKSLDDLINENPEKEEEINKEKTIQFSLENIPLKFQNSYLKINNKINQYIQDFNTFFYKDIFENFFFKIKKISR